MKLSEYIEGCQKILEEYGDLDVIYAIDDEGNDFNLVHHTPSVGKYEHHEFTPEEYFDDDSETVNSVCIN